MTIRVDRDDCPGAPRRALRYRRQTVEQMDRHDSVPVPASEALNLAKSAAWLTNPAVVKRFSQRLPGVARGYPAVQSVEPLDFKRPVVGEHPSRW